MADNSKRNSSGVIGLLGVVFVTLKLCHVINWSWWWVTAPFWGGFALLVALVVVFFAAAVLVALAKGAKV